MVFAARVDFNVPRAATCIIFGRALYKWFAVREIYLCLVGKPNYKLRAGAPLFAFNEPSVIMFRLVIKSGDFGVWTWQRFWLRA